VSCSEGSDDSASTSRSEPATVASAVTPAPQTSPSTTLPEPALTQAPQTSPSTTSAVSSAADTTPTGVQTTSALHLVPPEDPTALIGSMITASRLPQTGEMVIPPISINGADTNLSERAGACIDECMIDVAALADGAQPILNEAQYLLVREQVGRDELDKPIWRVIDVIAVRPADAGQSLELDPTALMCSLSAEAGDQPPIAAMMTTGPNPPRPVQVWGWDAAERAIQPLPVDSLTDCVFVGD
jgi:hypothetical protein